MKSIYFPIVLTAGLFVISCKKQYSCQCSTTFESPGNYPFTVSSVEAIDKKTTRRRAGQICSNSEKQLHENSLNYKYGSETVTTSCSVK
ncbi:MAG: hypothetical protein V4565_16045 [Bacteroidota bacterium]